MVAPRTVFNRLRSVKSVSTASVVRPEGELEEMINHITFTLHNPITFDYILIRGLIPWNKYSGTTFHYTLWMNIQLMAILF